MITVTTIMLAALTVDAQAPVTTPPSGQRQPRNNIFLDFLNTIEVQDHWGLAPKAKDCLVSTLDNFQTPVPTNSGTECKCRGDENDKCDDTSLCFAKGGCIKHCKEGDWGCGTVAIGGKCQINWQCKASRCSFRTKRCEKRPTPNTKKNVRCNKPTKAQCNNRVKNKCQSKYYKHTETIRNPNGYWQFVCKYNKYR
jgi:hypothetical protein